jgi:hypothetical protein
LSALWVFWNGEEMNGYTYGRSGTGANVRGDNTPQVPRPANDYMYVYYGPGEWTDAMHLMWLHDRLVREHKENPLYDYMWRLRDIIARLRLDEQQEPGCEI